MKVVRSCFALVKIVALRNQKWSSIRVFVRECRTSLRKIIIISGTMITRQDENWIANTTPYHIILIRFDLR